MHRPTKALFQKLLFDSVGFAASKQELALRWLEVLLRRSSALERSLGFTGNEASAVTAQCANKFDSNRVNVFRLKNLEKHGQISK